MSNWSTIVFLLIPDVYACSLAYEPLAHTLNAPLISLKLFFVPYFLASVDNRKVYLRRGPFLACIVCVWEVQPGGECVEHTAVASCDLQPCWECHISHNSMELDCTEPGVIMQTCFKLQNNRGNNLFRCLAGRFF